jgi:hypothetical protein
MMKPNPTFAEDFGPFGANFFLQLAPHRLAGGLASIDAALRHLPR